MNVGVIDSGQLKTRVRQHWEQEVCGSRYGTTVPSERQAFFDAVDRVRYAQDYMLAPFARFDTAAGKRVLEIGLGTGADFVRWVQAGAEAHGRDLTQASVAMVRERLALLGAEADVAQGDAENLAEFPDSYFDIYYSWGVLHHTPNTERTIAEAYRVLKPGGELRIMLYHYPSVGTLLLWLLYGPLRGRLVHPRVIVAERVESPGTKAYTCREAKTMLRRYFTRHPIAVRTYLGAGDLLEQKLSDKYQGPIWPLVQRLYPRWFVRHVIGHRLGTVMTLSTRK
jgi:ubiquinone/menaquinone biosynthesis C-methylase UbiE